MVAKVFAGISARNSNSSSSRHQCEPTQPYGDAWRACAEVNRPAPSSVGPRGPSGRHLLLATKLGKLVTQSVTQSPDDPVTHRDAPNT